MSKHLLVKVDHIAGSSLLESDAWGAWVRLEAEDIARLLQRRDLLCWLKQAGRLDSGDLDALVYDAPEVAWLGDEVEFPKGIHTEGRGWDGDEGLEDPDEALWGEEQYVFLAADALNFGEDDLERVDAPKLIVQLDSFCWRGRSHHSDLPMESQDIPWSALEGLVA